MQEAEPVPQQMSDETLGRLHGELVRRDDLQFDFPEAEPPQVPGWAEWLVRLFEAIGPFLKILFWAGLALGALLVVAVAAREVAASHRRRKPALVPAGGPVWAPEPAKARALLEDADRLAAEGRYSEAVHLLLFRSIDELAGRRPDDVRPALTSRDIAQIAAMPGSARSAFSRIAEVVEKSFFGGRPVGAGEFGECRRAYEAFAFAEGWA